MYKIKKKQKNLDFFVMLWKKCQVGAAGQGSEGDTPANDYWSLFFKKKSV